MPEPVLANLELSRENIAVALEEAARLRWCSRHTALEVARLWLYENPVNLYRLPRESAAPVPVGAEAIASA